MCANSWKPASLILLLVLALMLGAGWLNFNERVAALEQRISRLEEDAKALAPLAQVMRGYHPERATPQGYQASQATGPPNVTAAGSDSPLAWCPATEDGGAEWLELRYEPPVVATAIRIHANYHPGAVVRVLGGSDTATLTELWAGSGTPDAVQILAISSPTKVGWLKLELEPAKAPGWNEIDAVALIDAEGIPHWANEATASSAWGQPKPAPPAPR